MKDFNMVPNWWPESSKLDIKHGSVNHLPKSPVNHKTWLTAFSAWLTQGPSTIKHPSTITVSDSDFCYTVYFTILPILYKFTSIDVAIDVDRHRHLHNFTSIYVHLRQFRGRASCHSGARGGGDGRGVDSCDTMVKTNQKSITMKSMICWSKHV